MRKMCSKYFITDEVRDFLGCLFFKFFFWFERNIRITYVELKYLYAGVKLSNAQRSCEWRNVNYFHTSPNVYAP